MTRILLIGLLLVILRLAVRNFTAQLRGAVFGPPSLPQPPKPPQTVTQTLVPCTRCGTYVPADRVVDGVCEVCRG